MKHSCFSKTQIKIKIMSVSLAEGKALVKRRLLDEENIYTKHRWYFQ